MNLRTFKLFLALVAGLLILSMARPAPAGEEPTGPAAEPVDELPLPGPTIPEPEPEKPTPPKQMTPEEAARLKAQLDAVTSKIYKEARQFYNQHEWGYCIESCDRILKRDPVNLPAQKLKFMAERARLDHRLRLLEQETKTKDREAIADVDQASNMPDRLPPLPRPVKSDPSPPLPLRVRQVMKSDKMLAMEQKLNQRVDMNLIDADLDFVLSTLQRISGINVIADQAALTDKRLTILVEHMPLKEILRFIVRNVDGIAYTVTEDAVWVTEEGSSHPGMELRIHPLNVGMVASNPLQVANARGQPRQGGGRPTLPPIGAPPPGDQQQQQTTYLEDVIGWMETWDDWPAGSQWHIDRMTSSMMVNSTPEMHEKLAEMLEIIDRPPIQIRISTRFITIAVDDLADLGLDFQMNTKPGQDVLLGLGSGTDLGVTGGTGITAIVQGVDTDPLFTATIRALQQKGRSKVLTAPQIITLNNQKGIIDIGTDFNYVSDYREVSTTDVTVEGQIIERVSNYVPVLDRERVSFRLEVTPSVGRDLRNIILELHPKISDVSGGTGQFGTFQVLQLRDDEVVPPTPQPIFNDKELLTRLVVEDGGLVIIGGLMSQETSKTTTKVPILGDIPLLGLLFRRQEDIVSKSHLVIVVKAEVIDPSGRRYVDMENGAGENNGSRKSRPLEGPWFTYPEPGTANGAGN